MKNSNDHSQRRFELLAFESEIIRKSGSSLPKFSRKPFFTGKNPNRRTFLQVTVETQQENPYEINIMKGD